MRKKFFSLLVLLAAVVTSAMAQEESLLTTLTFGGSETYGETTSGVVTVTATNVGSYNGTYGWLLDEGGSLSVTAKEGYTITKCVFRQNAKAPITDTEAPFEIHANGWGTIIEDPEWEMNGVTSIEVYGYANAGGGSTSTVTWNSSTLSSIYLRDGQSFTQDGVTVTSLAGLIDGEPGYWMGGSRDASFKFSTSLGNFTKIEITGTIYMLGGSGWTQTSPGAVWTGEANETTFGMDFENVSQIVFTIGEPAPSTYTLQLVADPEKGSVAVTNLLGSGIVDNGNGNYTVPANAEVTILATPLEGYEFSGWKVGNIDDMVGCYYCGVALNTNDNPLTFTMTEDKAYLAEFAAAAPAATVVTITDSDFPGWGDSFTKDGVTVSAEMIDDMYGNISGPGSFSTTLGNFTKIEVNANYVGIAGEGWSGNSEKMTWTGNASSVSFTGDINGDEEGLTLKFTIESQGGTTAVENVQTNPVQATKFFRDGMLLIEKNGKIFNVTGAQVK